MVIKLVVCFLNGFIYTNFLLTKNVMISIVLDKALVIPTSYVNATQ
jgi:hypothetical protein